MEKTFPNIVAEKVSGNMISIVAEASSLAWGVKREFMKLRNAIVTIQVVLLDAVEKQANDHNLAQWLGKLREALYDAEDLFDDIQCEALQRLAVKLEGGIRRKVRNFFSRSNPLAFRLKMGHKIKEVSEKLAKIAAQASKFHLTVRNVDWGVKHVERYSYVRASDVIIGRDVDKEKIVSLLMHPVDGENVSIIPIVGIGGLGKTTLAKLVYNDEEVTRHFDLRMWLWVSQDFDVKRLAKEIYKSATGNYDSSVHGLPIDELYSHVRSTLNNKKYLLIMDDVWNDDLGKWMELKSLLLGGANGSKIIVTARSLSVSSIMGTIPSYNLEGLYHDECLSLFVKWAFRSGEEKLYPNLLEIGVEIVKKCRGHPLVVRTLGSLLYMETDEREWLSIKDAELWKLEQKENDIFPALILSYNAMPSYLKQCFAFCSIFPRGYEFTNFQLIQIWMAQGLLLSFTEYYDSEALGQRYIQELLSRSFFQQVKEEGPFFTFEMHDLMHDLAFLVMESDICSISSDTSNISERVRHLLFSDENDFSINEVSRSLLQPNRVRTISFPIEGVGPTSESFVETCISKFKYLRMLDLSDSCLEVLPSSIRELKHLRYLDLSNSRYLKKLPDFSFYDLPNLQNLGLLGCLELKELPTGIGSFISLRSLSLTTKQIFLPEETIGNLQSLRFLVIGGCGSLKRLPLSMKYLAVLETLHISHCRKLNLMKGREDILGLNQLRSVSIGQLQQSMVLPQWLCAAYNLEHIRIEDCPNLIALPEWLPSLKMLKKLEIINCPELVALPPQMQDRLTILSMKIENCPKLRSASELETGEEFPQITLLEETSAVAEITSASEQEKGKEFPKITPLVETPEMVEITWSRENFGEFVVSKRETDSTSKSSLPVEDSWWNLDLF